MSLMAGSNDSRNLDNHHCHNGNYSQTVGSRQSRGNSPNLVRPHDHRNRWFRFDLYTAVVQIIIGEDGHSR